MSDLHRRIVEAVDAVFDDEVAFTAELVRMPSLRGREGEAQRFYAAALEARGYAVETMAIDVDAIRDHPGFSPVTVDYSDALCVIATHEPRNEPRNEPGAEGGKTEGRSLILNGHMDVVPEGPHDMWEVAGPYEPHVGHDEDGAWLHGRGSADMKAGLAANLFALDALRSLGLQPAARVHIQSVVEEECTGNGALACLVAGYTADAAIIPEPEDDMLVRANVGVLWFAVHIQGRPVHVREAGAGTSAIEASYAVIAALHEVAESWNAERHRHAYFENEDHPINFNVGKIEGGDWASSVPAWCRLDCRIAIYPGDEPQDRADEIERHLREALADHPFLSNNPPRVEWNGFFAKGYVLEEGSDAEAALATAHRQATGADLATFTTPGYLDARVFVIYAGMPCLVYGPVSRNIHGFDERVSLDSLRRVTKTIALFIADWCGVEEIDP